MNGVFLAELGANLDRRLRDQSITAARLRLSMTILSLLSLAISSRFFFMLRNDHPSSEYSSLHQRFPLCKSWRLVANFLLTSVPSFIHVLGISSDSGG